MLILLSPSKKLDETSEIPAFVAPTQPSFLTEVETLNDILRPYDAEQLGKLMDISDKLANLNHERVENFQPPFTAHNARPALYTFKGDVYDKMDVANYAEAEAAYAQGHVRILSGLYGLLRPLDLMQPYRLEMGTKLKNKKGKNLYDFWQGKLAKAVAEAASGEAIVNLASQEYSKAADLPALGNVLTIDFKQLKDGKMKTFGLLAKRARGMMTDFAIKNKIQQVERLKDFVEDGYSYQPQMSSEDNWVFVKEMD